MRVLVVAAGANNGNGCPITARKGGRPGNEWCPQKGTREVATRHSHGGPHMRMPKRKLATQFVVPIALALGVFLIGAPSASSGAGADVYGVGGGSTNFGGTVRV